MLLVSAEGSGSCESLERLTITAGTVCVIVPVIVDVHVNVIAHVIVAVNVDVDVDVDVDVSRHITS
jgi:hypothetical protein